MRVPVGSRAADTVSKSSTLDRIYSIRMLARRAPSKRLPQPPARMVARFMTTGTRRRPPQRERTCALNMSAILAMTPTIESALALARKPMIKPNPTLAPKPV